MPKSKRKFQSKLKINEVYSNQSVNQRKECENDKNEINMPHRASNQFIELNENFKNKNEQNISKKTLKVKLFDVLKFSENNLSESKNYLSSTQKDQYSADRIPNRSSKQERENKKDKTRQNIPERTLKVKLFDILTCSEKYPNLSESINDLIPNQSKHYDALNKYPIDISFSGKKTYKKKLNMMENLKVQLCDIFTCSETNCFPADESEYIKTCRVQSRKICKNINKYPLSNVIKNKKTKSDDVDAKREHSFSMRSKRVCYSETKTDTENDNVSESLFDVIRACEYSITTDNDAGSDCSTTTNNDAGSDYELIFEDEETDIEDSDRESITETETETDTESNSDPESVYGAVKDFEYIPQFEKEEIILETCSESSSETEPESYSERDTETEVESNDTNETDDTESTVESNDIDETDDKKSKVESNDIEENDDKESKVESNDIDETDDTESTENHRLVNKSRGSDLNRKRKHYSKRKEQKKFRKWRLRSLKV